MRDRDASLWMAATSSSNHRTTPIGLNLATDFSLMAMAHMASATSGKSGLDTFYTNKT